MPFGFYIIMAAQFFSALADNALLIIAIAILRDLAAPSAFEPLLKTFFTISYVLLAAFVGAFADSMPKGRVMFISNAIKIVGCFLMLFAIHPIVAYAIVGLGAAAYSPAKYGILTEYLEHKLLVIANGWIEGLTVAAIILGVVLGGVLIDSAYQHTILKLGLGLSDSPTHIALFVVGFLYFLAALFNCFVPKTHAPILPMNWNPCTTLSCFAQCLKALWKDRLGQISLAVTTLFWGAAAVLQFIVIHWADEALNLGLAQSSKLQGVVAIGIAIGSVAAAKWVSLKKSVLVIPLGIVVGFLVIAMNFVQSLMLSVCLLILIGALSGFFVVPMNALLQHRGHMLMGAGSSIAVQNFNENLSILVMTIVYFFMLQNDISIFAVIACFGLLTSIFMCLVWWRHHWNEKHHQDVEKLL